MHMHHCKQAVQFGTSPN